MTAKQFYKWCRERGACGAGLREIRGKSPATWWRTTKRGDYMAWLCGKGMFPDGPGGDDCMAVFRPRLLCEVPAINVDRLARLREFRDDSLAAAKAYRKAFGNPFLKTRKGKSEVA